MAEPAAPLPAADSALLRFSVQRFNLSRKIKYSINGNLPTQSHLLQVPGRKGRALRGQELRLLLGMHRERPWEMPAVRPDLLPPCCRARV